MATKQPYYETTEEVLEEVQASLSWLNAAADHADQLEDDTLAIREHWDNLPNLEGRLHVLKEHTIDTDLNIQDCRDCLIILTERRIKELKEGE